MIVNSQQVHGFWACAGEHVYPVVESDMNKPQICRGDTFELNLQVFQTDGVTPQDITGATVRSSIKRRLEDLDAAALSQVSSTGTSVPTGGACTLVDALNGKINVRHSPLATRGLDPACSALYYDVQLTLADGRVWTIEYGTLRVVPDVTITN